MCATPDRKALRERRSRKGTLRGWKVMTRRGASLQSLYYDHTYVAGTNYPQDPGRHRVGRYSEKNAGGLHVYRKKPRRHLPSSDVIVPVTYQPKDVIAAEKSVWWLFAQVVVRKLRISQRAYDAAMKG